MKYYLCIDLKTFYASVECAERHLDPFKTDLVVADISRGRGTICLAITPKMKERGIKNRCRLYEVPKNIPLIIAKPRMKKYIEYSVNIYKIYLKYISEEDIYPYSIEETTPFGLPNANTMSPADSLVDSSITAGFTLSHVELVSCFFSTQIMAKSNLSS